MANGNLSGAGFWDLRFLGDQLNFVKDGSTDRYTESAAVFSQNEWQQFAVTWTGGTDSDADVNLYRNGQYLGNNINDADGIGLVADSGTQKWIGARTVPNNFFGGTLDDVRIYNRILSASEIMKLYNMGR
jgi:hypothetical protein